jgi:hypothetical protein
MPKKKKNYNKTNPKKQTNFVKTEHNVVFNTIYMTLFPCNTDPVSGHICLIVDIYTKKKVKHRHVLLK